LIKKDRETKEMRHPQEKKKVQGTAKCEIRGTRLHRLGIRTKNAAGKTLYYNNKIMWIEIEMGGVQTKRKIDVGDVEHTKEPHLRTTQRKRL